MLSGSSEEILKTAINTMHRSRGWIPLQNSNFFRIQMKNEITKHASDPIPPPLLGETQIIVEPPPRKKFWILHEYSVDWILKTDVIYFVNKLPLTGPLCLFCFSVFLSIFLLCLISKIWNEKIQCTWLFWYVISEYFSRSIENGPFNSYVSLKW